MSDHIGLLKKIIIGATPGPRPQVTTSIWHFNGEPEDRHTVTIGNCIITLPRKDDVIFLSTFDRKKIWEILEDLVSARLIADTKTRLAEKRAAEISRLKEELTAANNKVRQLQGLVTTLIQNDPDELVCDGGITVLDVWRKDAERML